MLNRRAMITGGATLLLMDETARARTGETAAVILAPSNLGLRPTEFGSEPGAWRAPRVLMDAGLGTALGVVSTIELPRPAYKSGAERGTRIRNGRAIRAFSLKLASTVERTIAEGRFPVVIGGDCSVLLGCLLGQRRAGGNGLVHADGHSDFYHPGNYDAAARLGSVAGMDLALATGRGEPLLTQWPDLSSPLANDADVVQFGERDALTFDYDNQDIMDTEITRILVQDALKMGMERSVERVLGRLAERALGQAWLHVDLDILDTNVMPAVDSPGSPGLNFEELAAFVRGVIASDLIIGVDFTIYDPERDPGAKFARQIVDCIAAGLAPVLAQATAQ